MSAPINNQNQNMSFYQVRSMGDLEEKKRKIDSRKEAQRFANAIGLEKMTRETVSNLHTVLKDVVNPWLESGGQEPLTFTINTPQGEKTITFKSEADSNSALDNMSRASDNIRASANSAARDIGTANSSVSNTLDGLEARINGSIQSRTDATRAGFDAQATRIADRANDRAGRVADQASALADRIASSKPELAQLANGAAKLIGGAARIFAKVEGALARGVAEWRGDVLQGMADSPKTVVSGINKGVQYITSGVLNPLEEGMELAGNGLADTVRDITTAARFLDQGVEFFREIVADQQSVMAKLSAPGGVREAFRESVNEIARQVKSAGDALKDLFNQLSDPKKREDVLTDIKASISADVANLKKEGNTWLNTRLAMHQTNWSDT